MESQKINLHESKDVGQTISVGMKILVGNYKHVFRTMGLMVLPIYLMATTMYFLLGRDMFQLSANPTGGIAFSSFGVNFFLTILCYYLAHVSLIWGAVYYVKLYNERGPGNFEMADLWTEVFKHGWKLLYALLIVGLLTGIVSVIAFLISAITIILIPVIYIGWIFIAAFLFFFPMVMLLEKEGISGSIDRTFKLLKGSWFKAIGILIVSYTMVMLTVIGPMMILNIIFAENIIQFEDGTPNIGVLLLVQNILQIFSLFFSVIIQFSFAVFYFGCLEKLDKIGLRERIAKLGPLA